MYVILLGLDVIGNPFGLAVGVARSVEDLFYEPFLVKTNYNMQNKKRDNLKNTKPVKDFGDLKKIRQFSH